MKMLKMIIYIFVWIFCLVQSDKCYTNSSKGVTESWFCCNNYEEKNGSCLACEIGYVSKDGLPCKPCSLGLWGRKCKNICSCKNNLRCDIVFGCIEMTTVVSGKWERTFTEPKELTYVATTSKRFSAADKNDGIFLKRELNIYSLSAGSIVVMVALASCCVKYKWKAKLANKPRSPRTHHDQVSSDQTNVQFNNESSAYDSIDEDNINSIIIRSEYVNQAEIRFSATVDTDVSRSSHSEGDAADPSSEDYLNPYQPMVEVDVHGYRLLAVESTQNSDEISSGSSTNRMSGSPRGKKWLSKCRCETNFNDTDRMSTNDSKIRCKIQEGRESALKEN